MGRKYRPEHVKRWMNHVAEMGCIICGSPAQLHHIRTTANSKSDLFVLPLCPHHHLNGPQGEAIHNGRFEFIAMHGSEWDLFNKVLDNLARRVRK